MSVASVQQHLQASGKGEQIAVGPYLSKLCETLSASMIGDNRAISLKVVAGDGATTSSEAVSLGLIVTELVINALKHAFPDSPNAGPCHRRVRGRWGELEAFRFRMTASACRTASPGGRRPA